MQVVDAVDDGGDGREVSSSGATVSYPDTCDDHSRVLYIAAHNL